MDRFVESGCAEHSGRVDYFHGAVLAADEREWFASGLESVGSYKGVCREVEKSTDRIVAGDGRCCSSRDAAIVDDTPSAVPSVDAGVLYRRGPQLWLADAVDIFNFPVVWICFRRVGIWFVFIFGFRAAQGSFGTGYGRGHWRTCLRLIFLVGLFECQDLRRLRLLAQQPQFFSDAVRYFIAAYFCDFHVVPLGLGHGRI